MSLKQQRYLVEDALNRLYDTTTTYAQKRVKKFLKKGDDDGDGSMSLDELKGMMDPDEVADLDGDGSGTVTEAELLDYFAEKAKKYLNLIGENQIDQCPKFFQYAANRLLVTLKLSSLQDQTAFLKAVDDCYDEVNPQPKKAMEALNESNPPELLKERIRAYFAAINWTSDNRTDEVFDNYDDGSGFMNTEEVSAALGDKVDFSKIDGDGSGFCSYGELRDYFQEVCLQEFKEKKYSQEEIDALNNIKPAFALPNGEELQAAIEEKSDMMMDATTDHEAVLDELVAMLDEESKAAVEALPFIAGTIPLGVQNAPSSAAPPKKSGGACGCC